MPQLTNNLNTNTSSSSALPSIQLQQAGSSSNRSLILNNYANYSPSATLTPGRKSASPTFFHSNDTLFNSTKALNPSNSNTYYSSSNNGNHIINGLKHSINNQYLNNYHHVNGNNNHHNSLYSNHFFSQSENHSLNPNNLSLSINHDSSLKIPTTPTRSKSLSPSLRCVIQPPRLRHKQQNKTNTNNSSSTTSSHENNNHNNQAGVQITSRTNHNQQRFQSENVFDNEQTQFKPIALASKKNNNNNENVYITNTHAVSQSSKMNSSVNEQKTDNSKKSAFLGHLNSTKPRKKSELDDETNGLVIKKPIAIMANEIKSVTNLAEKTNEQKSNENQSSSIVNLNKIFISTTTDNKQDNNNSNSTNKPKLDNINSNNKSVDIDSSCSHSNENSVLNECNKIEEELKINKFKLPFNVRMLNLNNFPPNQAPNSKRHFSTIMQKMKSQNCQNSDKCLNSLKQSIQFILNQELKLVFDKFREDFIEPAIKNINLNKSETTLSPQDLNYFLINLLDEAKNSYMNDIENLRDDFQSEKKSPSCDDLQSQCIKRKGENGSTEDLTDEQNSLVCQKKLKKTSAYDVNSDNEDASSTTPSSKKASIDSKTKFVLGKNANEIYFKLQQQFNETSLCEDSSTNNSNNENSNTKSIYTKFPNLFRYEADQDDRHWLNENQIIKRKNLKCFLLIFDEIDELFTTSFRLTSSSNNQSKAETNEDDLVKSDEFSLENKESILKQLKTFTLPDSILYKLKRQYCNKKFKQF